MSPDRVKCDIYQEMTTWVSVCKTHGYRFEAHVALTERCPIGRLEDLEARVDSAENALLAIARALSAIAENRS